MDSKQINSLSVSIPQLEASAPILPYPCKFKLQAFGLSQSHTVAREFHLIKRGGERRLDLHSVTVKNISASRAPDHDGSIFRELPNHCAGIRRAPLTDDVVGRTPTAGHSTQQDRQGDYPKSELMSGKNKWHDIRRSLLPGAIGRINNLATRFDTIKSFFGFHR